MTTLCEDEKAGQLTKPAPSLPRRVRVAESVYQRVDPDTGQPIPGKFEFIYRDSAGRQRWQTAKGDAKAERAEMIARLHRGERVERSSRTVGEVAEAWLERARGKNGPWDAVTRQRYDRIVRQQVLASVDEARRPLGQLKLRDVTVDHVAGWSQANEQALAPSSAKLALIALNQILRFAVRRGWIGINPVLQLEPGEKPRWRVKHIRILEGADLGRFLDLAGTWRVLFEFLAYTGLRIGEALGVRWCDVDLDAALLHVHQQLSRQRKLKHLKTEAGRRDVVLAPAVVRLLRERWLASPYKTADHLVFCKPSGEPGDYRDAGEGFRAAVKAAGLLVHPRDALVVARVIGASELRRCAASSVRAGGAHSAGSSRTGARGVVSRAAAWDRDYWRRSNSVSEMPNWRRIL
jgi:integrase